MFLLEDTIWLSEEMIMVVPNRTEDIIYVLCKYAQECDPSNHSSKDCICWYPLSLVVLTRLTVCSVEMSGTEKRLVIDVALMFTASHMKNWIGGNTFYLRILITIRQPHDGFTNNYVPMLNFLQLFHDCYFAIVLLQRLYTPLSLKLFFYRVRVPKFLSSNISLTSKALVTFKLLLSI